ncbi:uncharacterized protein LOC129943021 [Eupeodes corollae]|uniref:uncharacterized protein LOC129943021 n=1 Tax=Eupeodes corollae TaxID=290404 RepID=UPI0024905B24|nr:uncharacterized protein LOC129943021 [Eupeodes corollae]XP_055908198.1 uncharacterized protein LOC129943021 [Eupeodes corollae]
MPASQRYRTHDGTCNNRRRLRWGSAQMPFNRFLPPEYGDGVDSIRGSVEGGALSSARFVSLLVHGAKEGDAPLTLMIVQWGQLLDHDLTSTAQPRSINGSVPSCCGSKDFHPLCFPIKVPLDDPWLAPLKVRCLEFLRSAPAQRRDCVLSWREQTNQVTSFIDASPIYSSNAKTSDNARIFRNGLLIYGRGDPADDVCMRGAIAHQCIRSGDGRSGEQPGLLALHHVWVGEHNRIAMELSILNPHWSDEKVYQETRRIIGALFQHITYREFLPIVLGREVCKLFDLELLKSGYYTGYDPNINPTVSNAFAAAAFRFGHSLVSNTYMRCDRNHNFINNNVTLHEEFQQGDIGTAGSLHRLLRGMATQKALKRDEFITPELTNHLFQTPGFPFGLDLAAINIQRGRDHGIAPYTAWRQPCGLSAINTWDELANVVGPESAKRISHAYRNVHDIDLFVGGIAERPVIGGLVGPTFACIIAQQFSNSRKGDRFWYENTGFESSFTPAQLNSIRHVSLSSVLCRAVNGGTLQPYVFLPNEVKGNQRVKCGKDALEPIDLGPWLEQDPFLMSNDKIDQNINPSSTTSKEEKGINNRIQNVTNVDFIPNSSIGFHRVANMTKIHDKLDMKQKVVTSRPIAKPIRGINNKLDKNRLTVKKNPKPTASSASKRISTTRRTVVIHNVQIELRSANGAQNREKDVKGKKKNKTDSLTSSAQSTIMKVAGVVKSQINAAMGFLSDKDEDISTKHLSRKMNDHSAETSTQLTNSTNLRNETESHKERETTNQNFTTGNLISIVQNSKQTQLNVNDHDKTELPALNEVSYTTKELNETDTTQNEITDLKNKTSQNHQDFDVPKEVIRTTKNNKDQQVVTHRNSLIDSNSNDSQSPIKVLLKNNKNASHIFNESTTINEHYLTNTSETPTDLANDTYINVENLDTSSYDKLNEPHDTYNDFQAIINSALQDSLDQHKRVHRKSDLNHNLQQQEVKKVEFHTNLDFIDKLRTLRIDKTDDFPESRIISSGGGLNETPKIDVNENYFTEASDDLTLSVNTEQPSSSSSEISHNVELRQFQERPIYKRPQKLILDAPKSDQYEIEINIRQTNNNKQPQQTNANYEDYTNPNKRYDSDRYNQQYDFINTHQNKPNNAYFTPSTRIPYGTRTKPPTIIYIDEHDVRSTTRGPGLFQNILSFATNGLNSINKLTTTTQSPFNHNPNRIVNNGHNSASENYLSPYPPRPYQQSKPSSSYLSAQQAHTYPPTQGFPQLGFSQGPTNFNPASAAIPPQGFPHQNIFPPHTLPGANSFSTASNVGGVAHASSNAVSTGHFGAIAGSASSSGGDSTFSFNIRPSPRPQLNLMSPASQSGSKPEYELLPQRWSQYSSTPSYAIPPKPMGSVESFEYPPNKHDPFSSYTRRPPPYYNKKPSNVFDPAYDDIGRSELTLDDGPSKTNHTQGKIGFDNEDDYYYNDDDDDNFGPIFKNDNSVDGQELGKNDKIDYLKLAEQTLKNRTQLNDTELDDNFVLPMLRRNDDFVEPKEKDEAEDDSTSTNPTPTIGEQKSLGHDIFADAEDYDELLTARSSFVDSQTAYVTGQWNKHKKSTQQPVVAFAPIQVLTKPERPDNWVIFDAVNEKPLLPIQPDFNTDTLVEAVEVPMPFQKRKITRTPTTTPEAKTPNDTDFATSDSPDLYMTTTFESEKTSEEVTTDAIIDEQTTFDDNLTHEELDEVTETSDSNITTITEGRNLTERTEQIQEVLNFETKDVNENIDNKQTDYSTDITTTTTPPLKINSMTDDRSETEELTTLPNLT